MIEASTARPKAGRAGAHPGWRCTSGRTGSPAGEHEDPDREVDQEDPPPGQARSAGRRSAGRTMPATARDAGPDPDDHGVLGSGERGQQQSERGGHDRGPPRRLGSTRPATRRPTGRRGRAQRRGEVKIATPVEQEPPAAEVVGEPPGGHQQRGEDDRVGVEHPGQAGQARCRRKDALIAGTATLTMKRSSCAMNATETSTARIRHRRGWPFSTSRPVSVRTSGSAVCRTDVGCAVLPVTGLPGTTGPLGIDWFIDRTIDTLALSVRSMNSPE